MSNYVTSQFSDPYFSDIKTHLTTFKPSRSGKTRLVQRAVESVLYCNGYYVERKFEENSTQS